jgi:synaptic vesicle membrane protein VAT-1
VRAINCSHNEFLFENDLAIRQIWISKAGLPEVLVVKEAPDPQPTPGEVSIRVEARRQFRGHSRSRRFVPGSPVVPGYEVADAST